MERLKKLVSGKDQETVKEQRRQAKERREAEAVKVKMSKLDAEADESRQRIILEQQKLSQLESQKEELMESRGKRHVEDDDADAGSRKKPKFLENPFLAEKSSYNIKRFQVNNPFIKVVEATLEHMPADKVSDGKLMSKDALDKVVDLLLKPVLNTRKRYKSPHGELSGRIIHASALHGIKWITLPSGSTSHQVVDSMLTAGGKEFVSSAASLHESDEIHHEGEEQDFLTVEKYDFKGEHRDLTITGVDNLVTALIVECDWEGSLAKLYQGAAYGVTAARVNMQKNCYRPIYIENWSKSSWRYGVLRPEGIVRVRDGQVISMSGPNAPDGLVSSLQEVLDFSTISLQDDYVTPSQYPDDDYVCGCLHICNKPEMELPNTFDRYQHLLNAGGLLFLQSLVRIFVGDERALTLTVEEIERNYAARKAEAKEDLDYFKSSMDAAYHGLARRGGSGSKITAPSYLSFLPATGGTSGAVAAGGTSDTAGGTLVADSDSAGAKSAAGVFSGIGAGSVDGSSRGVSLEITEEEEEQREKSGEEDDEKIAQDIPS